MHDPLPVQHPVPQLAKFEYALKLPFYEPDAKGFDKEEIEVENNEIWDEAQSGIPATAKDRGLLMLRFIKAKLQSTWYRTQISGAHMLCPQFRHLPCFSWMLNLQLTRCCCRCLTCTRSHPWAVGAGSLLLRGARGGGVRRVRHPADGDPGEGDVQGAPAR